MSRRLVLRCSKHINNVSEIYETFNIQTKGYMNEKKRYNERETDGTTTRQSRRID